MNKLLFTCSAIGSDHRFKLLNTKLGQNESPEFILKNLDPHAKSIAIILEDLSHPLIHNFTHWVIWNIPATTIIAGKIPAGKRVANIKAVQGRAYGWHQYAGPKPPRGQKHDYRFTVYSLAEYLDLSTSANKHQFFKASQGKIIQAGQLTGSFKR
ncbi:YbhB/YbcL family Raf kinase inhibitor-like protein [Lactobacillus sp. ESL0684]|uniref:YbhB/YbcL family Raf kinase inhibitor-like protein n=1 Tax=Lactobacillus sp. ESL0684 TaxID=2983213 RepID=UPI0023F9D0EA|nr:YbhB/YbcL family Raf kinase inhibitor-like protein [Lactobacillus sp. ESL0684]WEV43561.1 YbhB/YbcL family Raf kinase inhibitor-like protein [Lactobacillus sp. ESL0684]